MNAPPRAKQVAGVWLPESETHFADMILHHSKAGIVDGKGTYQLHKLRAALRHQPAERRRVCLDIGAHVGLWAMWLVREFARVHAFEPVPAHADIFAFNVPAENATLHRVALGQRAGTVSIEVPLVQTGGAFVATDRPNPGTKYNPAGAFDTWHAVPMATLDGFAFEDVDFIKIDVEGYERPVVEGGRETIVRWRPNVVVEQKGNEAAYGEERDAAVAYLRGLGMKPLEVISGDWIMGW
ncbi:MAG: FkbM family methyltransferase [Kiloniellaceae bacterium]